MLNMLALGAALGWDEMDMKVQGAALAGDDMKPGIILGLGAVAVWGAAEPSAYEFVTQDTGTGVGHVAM